MARTVDPTTSQPSADVGRGKLPDEISAKIAALLAFERDFTMLPGSAVARRSRDHARMSLEVCIERHLARALTPAADPGDAAAAGQ